VNYPALFAVYIRVKRLLACVIALLAAGCYDSGSASGPLPSQTARVPLTALRITYQRDEIRNGQVVRVVSGHPITLRCDPPSGGVTDSASACSQIDADPQRFIGRVSGGSCVGPALRWRVGIRGVVEGRPVNVRYDMCDYPEARAWTDLGGTQLVGVVPAGSPEDEAGPQTNQGPGNDEPVAFRTVVAVRGA
jgi:hypothetical protein